MLSTDNRRVQEDLAGLVVDGVSELRFPKLLKWETTTGTVKIQSRILAGG